MKTQKIRVFLALLLASVSLASLKSAPTLDDPSSSVACLGQCVTSCQPQIDVLSCLQLECDCTHDQITALAKSVQASLYDRLKHAQASFKQLSLISQSTTGNPEIIGSHELLYTSLKTQIAEDLTFLSQLSQDTQQVNEPSTRTLSLVSAPAQKYGNHHLIATFDTSQQSVCTCCNISYLDSSLYCTKGNNGTNSAQTCVPDENQAYSLLLQNREEKVRVAAIAASKFIIETNYSSIGYDLYNLTVQREQSVSLKETLVTVSYNFQNLAVLINVEAISGYENGFQVTYVISGIQYSYFVLLTGKITSGTNQYNTVVLNIPDYSVQGTYVVYLWKNQHLFTGYDYTSDIASLSSTSSNVISSFVNQQTQLASIQSSLVSSAASAAYNVYYTNNNEILNWRVQIIDFNDVESKFKVIGISTSDSTIKITYDVTVRNYINQYLSYEVTVYQQSVYLIKYQTFDVVLNQVNNETFQAVLLVDGQFVIQYQTIQSVSRGHSVVQITEVDDLQDSTVQLVNNYLELRQVNVVQRQSLAAASVLVPWVLQIFPSDVELKTIQTNQHTSTVLIQQVSTGDEWSVLVRQLEWNQMDSLFIVRIQYETGTIVSYYVQVQQLIQETYQVSIVNTGIVLVTYRVSLNEIQGSSTTTINSVDIVNTPQQLYNVLLNYIDVIGGPKINIVSDYFIILTPTLDSVGSLTQNQIQKQYQIYTNPSTNSNYLLFLANNTVTLNGQVVSPNGGRQWILNNIQSSLTANITRTGTIYNISNQLYTVQQNGSVSDKRGNLITQNGLSALLNILINPSVQNLTETYAYYLYEVRGTDQQFIVFTNNTVVRTDTQEVISQGGFNALQNYVQVKIDVADRGNYLYAGDTRTGFHYNIYPNGSVFYLNGTFVCQGGAEGLASFLSSKLLINSIVLSHANFDIAVINLQTYYIYDSGVVTQFPQQTVITQNGYNDLVSILSNQNQGSVTINQAPQRWPGYFFSLNGRSYYLYQNRTRDLQNGQVIYGGYAGFKNYIVSQITQKTTYNALTDKSTNNVYYIYPNGTITTSKGLFLDQNGLESLIEYLTAKQQSGSSSVTVAGVTTKTETLTYKIYYSSAQNQTYYVLSDGLLWDRNLNQTSYIFSPIDFYINLAYISQQTIQRQTVFQQVKLDNQRDSFLINPEGTAYYSNFTFVSVGGLQGLIRYLTIQNISKASQFNNYVIFESQNLVFQFNNNAFLEVVNNQQSQYSFCQAISQNLSYNCFYNYLVANYYEQIISSLTKDQTVWVFTHTNGTHYLIYPTGIVTDENGNVICIGGQQSLQNILYQNQPAIIPSTNAANNLTVTTVNITYNYNIYFDEEKRQYFEFSNGTIFNVSSNSKVQSLPEDVIYNSYGQLTLPTVVTLVVVNATNQTYYVTSSGDVYSKSNVYITTGGINGLLKFVFIQSQVQLVQTEQFIYIVNQTTLNYFYQHNPETIYNQTGNRICRNWVNEELIACLVNNIAVNNYQLFIKQVPVDNQPYDIYTYNNTFYYVYHNGTVLNSNNYTVIFNGGATELIRYLNYRYNQSLIAPGQGVIYITVYNDIYGNQFWLYPNGSLLNITNGQIINQGSILLPQLIIIRYDTNVIPNPAPQPDSHTVVVNPTQPSQPPKRPTSPASYNGSYTNVVNVEVVVLYIDQQRNNYSLFSNGTLINTNTGQVYTNGTQSSKNLILVGSKSIVTVTVVRTDQVNNSTLQQYIYTFVDQQNNFYYVFQNGTIVNQTSAQVYPNRTDLIINGYIIYYLTQNFSDAKNQSAKASTNITINQTVPVNVTISTDHDGNVIHTYPNNVSINTNTSKQIVIRDPSSLVIIGNQTNIVVVPVVVPGSSQVIPITIEVYIDQNNNVIWVYPNGTAININSSQPIVIDGSTYGQLILIGNITSNTIITGGQTNNITHYKQQVAVYVSQLDGSLVWVFINGTSVNQRTNVTKNGLTGRDLSSLQLVAVQNITFNPTSTVVNSYETVIFNSSVIVYYVYRSLNGGQYNFFPSNNTLKDLNSGKAYTNGGDFVNQLSYQGTNYSIEYYYSRNVTVYVDQTTNVIYYYYPNGTVINTQTNIIVSPQVIQNLSIIGQQTINIYPGNQIVIDYSKQNTTTIVVILQVRVYVDKNSSLYYLYPNGTFVNVASGQYQNFSQSLRQLTFMTFFNLTQVFTVSIVADSFYYTNQSTNVIVYLDNASRPYWLFENGTLFNVSSSKQVTQRLQTVLNTLSVSGQDTYNYINTYVIPGTKQFINGSLTYTIYIVNNQTNYIYPDGRVVDQNGNIIGTGGFQTILNVYNNTQLVPGQSSNPNTFIQNNDRTIQVTYTDSLGNQIRLYPDGSLFNVTAWQFIIVWDSSIFNGLVVSQTQTINRNFINDTNSGFQGVIYPDGSVWSLPNLLYVTPGGVQGAKDFLDVYNNINSYQKNGILAFPDLNMSFTLQNQSGRYQAFDWNDRQICDSSTQDESEYCVYVWVIPFYKLFKTSTYTYYVNTTVSNYTVPLTWIISQYYNVYNGNTSGDFYVAYKSGSVQRNGNASQVMTKTGGLTYILKLLNSSSNPYFNTYYSNYSFIAYSNQLQQSFEVFNQTGVVQSGQNLICTSGGLDCLAQYVQTQLLDTNPQQIVSTTVEKLQYSVYVNGTVIDTTTKNQPQLICQIGGINCLHQWLDFSKAFLDVRVSQTHYFIYNNGTVAFKNGTFATDNGLYGLYFYLNQVYTVYTFQQVTYYIYSNGSSYYTNGTYFTNNGQTGINQKVTGFTTYTIQGATYYINVNGSCYDSNYILIATGGYSGLSVYLNQFNYQQVTYNSALYYIYTNGTVTTSQGVFITTGGINGLMNFTAAYQNEYSVFLYQNQQYHIFADGTIYLNGVLITNGGINGLLNYFYINTYYNTTIDNLLYKVYQNGSVYRFRDNSYVCNGGMVGLNQFLVSVSYTVAQVDGQLYRIYNNGSVYLGNTYITDGGLDGLRSYIVVYISKTVNINNISYSIYTNGTVYDQNGTFIVQGGLEGLQAYIFNQQYSIYQSGNKIYWVYVNGTVTTSTGVFISNGGFTGLQYYLQTNTYQTVQFGNATYFVYSNGTVTTNQGVFVVNGGVTQLQLYVQGNSYQIVNASNTQYFVYQNGTVTTLKGVYVTNGGVSGLQTYLQQSSYQTAQANGVTYYIYTNGTVTTKQGVYVTNGGTTGLQTYLQQNSYQTVVANSVTYYVYTNGTVTTTRGEFVTTGGTSGLQTYLQNQQPQVVSSNGVNYYVYQNGSVYSANGQFVTVGGTTGLQTYLQNNQYQTVQANGVNYRVYPNGDVTTATGVYLTTGGVTGLQNYVQQQQYQVISANGVNYYVYGNGTVTTTTGVFVTIGGTTGLQSYLAQSQYQTATANGKTYYIYSNGTVTTDQGVFVTTGGTQGLQNWIQQNTYQAATAGGKTYHIYSDGTVTTDQGVYVTQGGANGLQIWIEQNSYQVAQVGGKSYYIYTNGTVTTDQGIYVTEGGVTGLQTWIQENNYQVAQAGGNIYYIYGNGTVTTDSGDYVTDGGSSGLQYWIEQNSYQVASAGGKNYYIYGNGTVTTDEGEYVTEGGQVGLQTYLQENSYSTATVDGSSYYIYGNGTVTTSDGVFVTTGGVDGLTAYLQGQGLPPAGEASGSTGGETTPSSGLADGQTLFGRDSISTGQNNSALSVGFLILVLAVICGIVLGYQIFKKEKDQEIQAINHNLKEKLLGSALNLADLENYQKQ